MKKTLIVLLSLVMVVAFCASAVASPPEWANNKIKHHGKKLLGKVQGNPNGTPIEDADVWVYWWNKGDGSAVVEIYISGLNEGYTVDVYDNGSPIITDFTAPSADVHNDDVEIVNTLRARKFVYEPGQHNIEVRVNVTKNKKLYVEYDYEIYVPAIEAYFTYVYNNGDTVNLIYNVNSVFEEVIVGDHVAVSIDGEPIGSGYVSAGNWGNLQLIISNIFIEEYRMKIMGFRETSLKFMGSGTIVELGYIPLYPYL